MMNNLNFLFFILLIFGTLISISSNSIFAAWMGLEINLLSFIPILGNNKNIFSNESMLKYFLIQAIGSSLFLFSCILLSMNFLLMDSSINFIFLNLLIFFTLSLKLGSAPFHNWFINIIEGMTWMASFLILTWQKLAPLCLLSYLILPKSILLMFIVYSTIIGAVGGLAQSSLRKILAYSSVNHLGWLMTSCFLTKSILILYFMIYLFINSSLILHFNKSWLNFINQTFFILNNKMNIYFSFSLLSLGGLPPLLGFFPKWIILEKMIFSNFYFLAIILILFSMVTLYYYIQITLSSFMMLNTENKLQKKFNLNFSNSLPITLTSILNILGLILFFIFKT